MWVMAFTRIAVPPSTTIHAVVFSRTFTTRTAMAHETLSSNRTPTCTHPALAPVAVRCNDGALFGAVRTLPGKQNGKQKGVLAVFST